MQILFISDQLQALNFLSGLHAEAIMAVDSAESDNPSAGQVTVVCQGASTQYPAMIIRIDNGYSYSRDGKWLDLKFIVRRSGTGSPGDFPSGYLQADA